MKPSTFSPGGANTSGATGRNTRDESGARGDQNQWDVGDGVRRYVQQQGSIGCVWHAGASEVRDQGFLFRMCLRI